MEFIPPQLATLQTTPPQNGEWIHEIKFDGYRTLAMIENKRVTLRTRNGFDWTDRYKPIAAALKKAKVKSVTLDGEIVWMNEDGKMVFSKASKCAEV